MTQQAQDEIPDYCDLTPEKLKQRTPPAIQMMERAIGIEDEDKGYTFLFPGDHETLQLICDFVFEERQCCPMGTFKLEVHGKDEPIRFTFIGPEGMKLDIREGMQLERWFDEVP